MDINKAFELADWFWTLHPDERRDHYWIVSQFIKDIYCAGYVIESRYTALEDVAMQPVREDTEQNAIDANIRGLGNVGAGEIYTEER